MRKHRLLICEEKTSQQELKVFNIFFNLHFLALVIYSAFDLRSFNKEGYLYRLIENFKEAGKSCYILFSSFGGTHGASSANIDKILNMTSSYLALEPIMPEKWAEKVVLSSPNPIYFLLLTESIQKIQQIFEYIDSIDTWSYFIFEEEKNKDSLYAKIKELRKKNLLNEQSLCALGLEAIRYRICKYGAEEEFRIFTKRFNIKQVKDLVLESIDTAKFEVIIK